MNVNYDIAVIGSGPGGYVAAIRAAQLGYKVTLIEKYDVLGGTCTNVGCIPSKAMLDSSKYFYSALNEFADHGILTGGLELDFSQFVNRKKTVVQQNNKGLSYLMEKNGIQVITGTAKFISYNEIHVQNGDLITRLKSRYAIIATGSKPASLPGITIDRKKIITSTEALSLKEVPKDLTVVGGGIIGVELASVFARLGSKVTILEYADSLIPTMDRDLGKGLYKHLKKIGVEINLGVNVKSSKNSADKVITKFSNSKGNLAELKSDYTLVAVGRRPYTSGLGLEDLGIFVDNKGFIPVNENFKTVAPNIFAVGDVIGGPMLAHKAEEEGTYVVEFLNGQKPHINYRLIPGVVYTWPEIASVGYTQEELLENNIPFKVGKFPISALGRARAAGEKEGFVKVLSEPKYGEILGIHILGPRAADLIAQGVVSMEFRASDEDLARISYAHPTYSEALKEAYLEAFGQGAFNL